MSRKNKKNITPMVKATQEVAYEVPSQQVKPYGEIFAPAATLASEDATAFAKEHGLASDSIGSGDFSGIGGYLNQFYGNPSSHGFIGYARCSDLSQAGLMQAGVQTLADEMTRKFIDVKGGQDEDSAAAVEKIQREFKRLDVKAVFRTMAEYCGYFGGGLLFVRLRGESDLSKPIAIAPEYIGANSIDALIPVEPINVSPVQYNSTNPLRKDYFKPTMWMVNGVGPVHATRFLKFVKNEPPMLLRPAYNFFGVPDVQIALDYLLHFTETREAAARLLTKFSLTILKTGSMQFVRKDAATRVQKMVQERDNDGMYVIDNETEDIVQLNTPLSGITDIVRQGLELLACIWRIPVVKFLGVTPGGLNATGDSDIRNFYDHVVAQREKIFAHPLDKLFKMVQLSLFGQIRTDLSYDWPSLWEMTEREQAEVAKLQAETDAVLVNAGVLDQSEPRTRISTDPMSQYAGIDPQDVPAPREMPDAPFMEGQEGMIGQA